MQRTEERESSKLRSKIIKKVRSDASKLLKSGLPIKVLSSSDALSQVTNLVLTELINDKKRLQNNPSGEFLRIVPWCLEDEISEGFKVFFENENCESGGIKLLKSISINDIDELAKELSLPPTKHGLPKVISFLKPFESRDPGVKFSLLKSLRRDP